MEWSMRSHWNSLRTEFEFGGVLIQSIVERYRGVHSHWGIPKKGCFITENPMNMNHLDHLGVYPHDLGNLHIEMSKCPMFFEPISNGEIGIVCTPTWLGRFWALGWAPPKSPSYRARRRRLFPIRCLLPMDGLAMFLADFMVCPPEVTVKRGTLRGSTKKTKTAWGT
jgi:hypothetical protein